MRAIIIFHKIRFVKCFAVIKIDVRYFMFRYNGCKIEIEGEVEEKTFVVEYVLNELVIAHTHTHIHVSDVLIALISLFIVAFASLFSHSGFFFFIESFFAIKLAYQSPFWIVLKGNKIIFMKT